MERYGESDAKIVELQEGQIEFEDKLSKDNETRKKEIDETIANIKTPNSKVPLSPLRSSSTAFLVNISKKLTKILIPLVNPSRPNLKKTSSKRSAKSMTRSPTTSRTRSNLIERRLQVSNRRRF